MPLYCSGSRSPGFSWKIDSSHKPQEWRESFLKLATLHLKLCLLLKGTFSAIQESACR